MTHQQYDSLKKTARDLYLSRRVANLRVLSRDLKVPYEIIKQWHSEDNWLSVRTKRNASKRKKLVKTVGSPEGLAKDILRTAKAALAASERELKRASSATEVQSCVRMLRDSQVMAREAFQDLGLLRK